MHIFVLQGLPTKSVSMDNFSRGSPACAGISNATGEVESVGVNGTNVQNLSGSSGLICTPKSGSLSSFDDKERACEQTTCSYEKTELEEDVVSPSGNMVTIPPLPRPLDVDRERQSVNLYIHIHVHCVYTYMYIHVQCTCMYMYMYIRMHIYTCTCTCT